MNRLKAFAGLAAAVFTAIGAFTAQAATRTWTGSSEVDKNWTTAENWSDNTAPTASDTAKIGSADIVIDVEGSDESNPAVGALTVDANAKVKFTGQKRLYTGTSNSSIGSAAEITIQGIDNPFVPEGEDPDITNASVIVRGVQNTLAKTAKVTVTGKGSRFEVQNLSLSASSVNAFTANNGGEIDFSPYAKESKTLYLTLNSLGGGFYWPKNASGQQLTISGGKLTLNITNSWSSFQGYSIGNCTVVANLKNTTVKFGGFSSYASGSSIKLDDSGFKTDYGFTYGNSYASPIEMRGANPYIQTSGGGFDIKGANVTVTLVPELTWDEKATPLFYHVSSKGSGNVYFRDGWKCTVDVSKFAHFYGTKTITILSSNSVYTRNLYLPAVTVVGEGAENCKVTFSRDKNANNSNYMYMTIESQNPPVGSVVRIVRNGVKYYYNSLEEAFAAAQANDTISPIANVSLKNSVTVSQAVTLDPNTFCVSGDDLTSAPFKVTDGTLTIKGTGAINGGTNTAVCVTGGSFSSPADSTVTFLSTNDTIVVSADGTANILGGTFKSEDGQPVVSVVNGILRGGLYNKEPALALIAEDYTTEKVGDLWEVVLDGVPICKVGDRTFASLEKAYAVVPNNGDIFMIADAVVPPLTMDRDIAFTLVLEGFKLTPETAGTLFTVEAGMVDFYDHADTMGALKGGIVVKGGTVNVKAVIVADPALTVDGGTVSVWNKSTFNGTVTLNGGTLNMNATVDADDVAITANGGTLNVSGGSYTGDTSAFVAGPNFTCKGISAGSFSSVLDAKYLADNRMLKQVGDRYEVVLASDKSAVTYTWNGGVSGDWANPDNWTPSKTPCFGIPSNSVATAKFSSASDNIVVNLGGGNYQIGTLTYTHYWRQIFTNGTFRLSSGSLKGDRHLVVIDGEVVTADPVYAKENGIDFQLGGNAKATGDVSPNASSTTDINNFIVNGSNEVTGVIHNRNTLFNVKLGTDATLIAGEIRADNATKPLNVSLAKGATMKVGKIVAADVAGKFDFTFAVPATGLTEAPVSFAQNDDNVALDDKTAIKVNIDAGFVVGSIPLFSGVGLSASSLPSVTVSIAGKSAASVRRMKISLVHKDGVISLVVQPSGLAVLVR